MRSGNGHGVVPCVSVGGTVVVAPIELHGGVFAPDFHGAVERIARSLVGVFVGQGETVLGGQVAFQQLAVTVGQFTVVHHVLGDLANGVFSIVVEGAELEPLRHEPIVVRTGGGLVVRAFLASVVNDAGGVGCRVLALVLGDVQAPVGVANVVTVVDPSVEVETVGDASVVAEEPVAAVGGDHALALVAVHVSAVAGYADGGVAFGAPFAHFGAVAEVVAGPHTVALVLEVDYGPVVQGGLGSAENGPVVHVVHVATIARHVEPAGDRAAVGYALDGGSIKPDAQTGQGVGLPLALELKGYPTRAYYLGVDGGLGRRDVGGGSRLHGGNADGHESSLDRGIGSARRVGGLGSVVVLLAARQSGYGFCVVGARLHCTHGDVAVPTGIGKSLVYETVVQSDGGGVGGVMRTEATDEGGSRGGEGGGVGVVYRDDRGQGSGAGREGDGVGSPTFAGGVLGLNTQVVGCA